MLKIKLQWLFARGKINFYTLILQTEQARSARNPSHILPSYLTPTHIKNKWKSKRSANPFVQREAKVWNQCSGRQIQKAFLITQRPGHLFNYPGWTPQQPCPVWALSQGWGGSKRPVEPQSQVPLEVTCQDWAASAPAKKTYSSVIYFLWTSTSCQERDFLTRRID